MTGTAGQVAILGAGMHPWGKWGANFVEYGLVAARDALGDAGLSWPDVQFVAAGETIRNGYPEALAYFYGKVMECASFCAEPFMGKESILGRIEEDAVYVTAMHPGQRCTPASIAGG